MKKKLSPRLALVVIAAMFVLPLLLAWLMYSGNIDYNPVDTRNLGELVQPPVPVELESLQSADGGGPAIEELQGHWVLVYALPESCGASCIDDVTALRQVHRASGKNQARIQILLLGPEPDLSLQDIYRSFHLASDPTGQFRARLDGIAGEYGAPSAGSLYLADPLGNIMLFYAAGFDANDLKKDLKRLLTWSKLDEH